MHASKKLIQADLTKYSGNYQNQLGISVRNKYILMPDLILRSLCPDPTFTDIILEICSQSFINRHILADGDHLYVEHNNTNTFKVTTAVARQLAYLSAIPEYHAWQRSIALFAGAPFATIGGKPWDCPLPKYKLIVTFTVIDAKGIVSFYRIISERPELTIPFRQVTVYLQGKSETLQIV